MSKIKIITDTTSYIAKDFAEKHNISVVSLNYSFDGLVEKEGFPGEFENFFNRLANSNLFPTTSQPSTGEFIEVYQKAISEGYESIIVILLSSKLSGTYSNAVLAKNMLGDERITIIDSQQVASNLRFLVEDALNMTQNGHTKEEIVAYIEEKKKKMFIYLTVDTLEYLKRGGRLSSIQSIIGDALNIKPIIMLDDGELKLIEKVRGKSRAITSMVKKIPEDVKRISICHVLNEAEAVKIKESLEKQYSFAQITIDEIGPVIGCHIGPKALGICFY
ncbi:MAG: DegV family protein [Tissierellia bacterium]|nr:DegV family protein [Tissierellia bacterium]